MRAKGLSHDHWRLVDPALAAAITLAIFGALYKIYGIIGISWLLKDARNSFYVTVAQLAGSLLGFTITGVSILAALGDSPRIKLIRSKPFYKDVFATFVKAWKALSITTVVSIVGIFADKDQAPRLWITAMVIASVVYSTVRLARSLWVLENMLLVSLVDQAAPRRAPVNIPAPPDVKGGSD